MAVELTEAQSRAMEAIANRKEIWPEWARVEAEHGPAVLAELVELKMVARWERPDVVCVVLTQRGAARMGVVAEEYYRSWESREKRYVGKDRRMREVKVRRIVAVPRWQPGERTDEDHPQLRHRVQRRRLEGVVRRCERPIEPPRGGYEREILMDWKAIEVIKDRGKKYISDWSDGETTTDPEAVPGAARLLNTPVLEDPRLKGAHRLVKKARGTRP